MNRTLPHPEERASRASRRMKASAVASWFETAQGRLLTMRGGQAAIAFNAVAAEA
jgi:hypothetical protein